MSTTSDTSDTPNNFLLYIGDGEHFNASSSKSIWGINTITSSLGKWFTSLAKEGDLLWFVTSKSKGRIVAVATFTSENKRILDGPLSDRTLTNAELGWDKGKKVGKWDTEIHYKDLYNLTHCDMFSELKGPSTIRRYERAKCKVDLIAEYPNIVRYSKVTKNM